MSIYRLSRRSAVPLFAVGLLWLELVLAACTPTGQIVRPVGLEGLVRVFGERCAPATNAGRTLGIPWGYNCRLMSGSSTKWSVHSWGVALDLNTLNNPRGQSFWNGNGGFPTYGNRGMIIPTAYQNQNFYWGLNFSTPDPMHFQYVEGY